MATDNYNPFSLSGKTILVTGASSGIGRATAIECSKMGAKVILTARNEERLNETLSMMEGENHLIIPADMAEEEAVIMLAKTVPSLNGVVCAAGTAILKPLKYYSTVAVESIFRINTFSSMFLVRELLRAKKICNGASLVFVSSVATSIPASANGIYSASKAALEAFSSQCAFELSSKGIRSNTINPGMVLTNLLKSQSVFSEEDMVVSLLDKTSLFGRFAKAEEIAWSAIYLLSDASSYVTGGSLVIDGGYQLMH